VKVGIFADSTDRSMPILDLAQAVEERAFTGLFLNEHPHLPVAHARSSYPPGGEIPERYARFWDPYIALSFVAARTSLEIGPCISLVAEHDAIALAKAVATLDVLSGGRLLLGVGFGWHREEFEDHGRPAKVRAKVVEETVELMRSLWVDEVASFEGEHLRLSPSRSWPKPRQEPHPPVLLGAPASERNFRRVAAWADGWIPMASPVLDGTFERWLDELRTAWADAGRDGEPVVMPLLATVKTVDLAEALDRLRTMGIDRVAVHVGEGDGAATCRRLDALASRLDGGV
jgi:probable F420-dependent oxidoreductase